MQNYPVGNTHLSNSSLISSPEFFNKPRGPPSTELRQEGLIKRVVLISRQNLQAREKARSA